MSATQGRGVQVTHFSGQTTQFDDILIEKGIITKEQALVAKLGEDPTQEQLDSVAEILVKEKLDKMGFFEVEPPMVRAMYDSGHRNIETPRTSNRQPTPISRRQPTN